MELVSSLFSLQFPGWTCLYQSQGTGKSIRPQPKHVFSSILTHSAANPTLPLLMLEVGRGKAGMAVPTVLQGMMATV